MSCLACDLTHGDASPPGGRLHQTSRWVVEHCIGPLGLGALIVKPFRHVTSVAELDDQEAAELGPLLRLASRVASALVGAEQVYNCLWSHAGATPGHVHYVIQPVTQRQVAETGRYGPALQMQMFVAGRTPSDADIAELAARARELFTAAAGSAQTRGSCR